MPPAGFEPAIPTSERLQTLTLDQSATGVGAIEIFYRPIEDQDGLCRSGSMCCWTVGGVTRMEEWRVTMIMYRNLLEKPLGRHSFGRQKKRLILNWIVGECFACLVHLS
jgi:hypothetical protein